VNTVVCSVIIIIFIVCVLFLLGWISLDMQLLQCTNNLIRGCGNSGILIVCIRQLGNINIPFVRVSVLSFVCVIN